MLERTGFSCLVMGGALALAVGACGGDSDGGGNGSGGSAGQGGGAMSGGGPATGGTAPGTGGSATGANGGTSGGPATGGSGATAGSATGGSGATGGTAGTGANGGGAMGGTAGSGATGGTAGAGCGVECTGRGFICCGEQCVNPYNDHRNCGTCGNVCGDGNATCTDGNCAPPVCADDIVCIGTTYCCGDTCCEIGRVCCAVPGPVGVSHSCIDYEETCPRGCLDCDCAAPDTPVATPEGERPISEIEAGDLVYSVDRGRLAVVPVGAVRKVPVERHRVLSVTLESGAKLAISPGHPTADGRRFAALRPGDLLDGLRVRSAELVDYDEPYTHDILPRSDSGAYFAAGVLIGSTLSEAQSLALVPDASRPSCGGILTSASTER